MSEHGWYVIEVVRRPPGEEEFALARYHRGVERTFAWLGRCRIHGRDYEWKTTSDEVQVQVNMVQLMLHQFAGKIYYDNIIEI